MATVESIAEDEGASLKQIVRQLKASAITFGTYQTNLSGPNTTTITNALKANENIGRPKSRRR
jgi:hypothetical protein